MQARSRGRSRPNLTWIGLQIWPGNSLGKPGPGLGRSRPGQVWVGALRHASLPGLTWTGLLRRLLAIFTDPKVSAQLSWRYYVPFLGFGVGKKPEIGSGKPV